MSLVSYLWESRSVFSLYTILDSQLILKSTSGNLNMSSRHDCPYELILFGASGFTGKLCAEHITTHLPADLKWAIAGRNESKLLALKKDLHQLNPDRSPPGTYRNVDCRYSDSWPKVGIETSSLERADLDQLAKKTRLIINTVGPYSLYGASVVEACANSGTHYLDVWVYCDAL